MPKLLLLLMFNFSWRCFRCHEEVKKRYGYDSGYYEKINETDSINLIITQDDLCNWGLCLFQTLSQQQRFHIEEFSPVYLSACVWPRKLISYLADEAFYRKSKPVASFPGSRDRSLETRCECCSFHFCSTSNWRWFTLFFPSLHFFCFQRNQIKSSPIGWSQVRNVTLQRSSLKNLKHCCLHIMSLIK